jgi:hypothetical protein
MKKLLLAILVSLLVFVGFNLSQASKVQVLVDGVIQWEKDFGQAPSPILTPAPIPTPIPIPVPAPILTPTGPEGSKTNPIKMSKYSSKGGYIPSISPDNTRGAVSIPPGAKWYFEFDPIEATKKPGATSVAMGAKFYGGGGLVCQLTQNKITGTYTPETCGGYTSFMVTFKDNNPYDLDNTKFLLAIDNSGGTGVAHDEVGASIFF